MSQPPTGIPDLSALAQPQQPAAGAGPGIPGELIVSVTEATFGEVVQRSQQVPVLVNLTSARSAASGQLTPVLEKLAREYGGRFQLATVDADGNGQIAAAFQVQALPTVVALIGGRPAPLFQGAYPEEQVRQVIDEVLRLAQQSGVTGTIQVAAEQEEQEPEEKPLPPLHAEALAAIERGDLPAAEEAYTRALKENPGDGEAKAALAQVQLLQRAEQHDAEAVLAAAAEAPAGDLDAQFAAADVEAVAGRFSEAFARLLRVIRATAGEERDAARTRLVELFDIAGPEHPDVAPARRQLASALY